MQKKRFKLSNSDIVSLANGFGGCIATDKITVDGLPVRLMYREEPAYAADSGWRFLAGLEDDEYMNDASNHGVYDVNTIANYDPSIIPHLDSEVGSVLEKLPGADGFEPVKDGGPPDA